VVSAESLACRAPLTTKLASGSAWKVDLGIVPDARAGVRQMWLATAMDQAATNASQAESGCLAAAFAEVRVRSFVLTGVQNGAP
jgi:hypothetical protein